ncbi:MAG: helix-turn-helix domain-containing protein [Proteobacteria bacterium]|nr:helix-turn-helix domain-containing protein [Pseudomonadota bacterium]MBU1741045.1 helix-turn-helix domain-containing protein [Pseudomonadota bacterium]
MNTSPFLDTRQAAQYLGLSPRTLEKWRLTGSGPTHRKFGSRVLYSVDDLDLWAKTRRRRSTSETPGEEGNKRG